MTRPLSGHPSAALLMDSALSATPVLANAGRSAGHCYHVSCQLLSTCTHVIVLSSAATACGCWTFECSTCVLHMYMCKSTLSCQPRCISIVLLCFGVAHLCGLVFSTSLFTAMIAGIRRPACVLRQNMDLTAASHPGKVSLLSVFLWRKQLGQVQQVHQNGVGLTCCCTQPVRFHEARGMHACGSCCMLFAGLPTLRVLLGPASAWLFNQGIFINVQQSNNNALNMLGTENLDCVR